MDNKFTLKILPLFEEDLNEIVDYISINLKNPIAANRLVDDVMEVRRLVYSRRDLTKII